jgi:cytochrome c biogenesis protein CcmG/thiol:disulfide interchange protein DsbE
LACQMLRCRLMSKHISIAGCFFCAGAAIGFSLFGAATVAGADAESPMLKLGSEVCRPEKLPVLKVGWQVYSNVTITSITATDIHFEHSQGIATAKLKNLEPELQKLFDYDAEKAREAEQKQHAAAAQFREELNKPAAPQRTAGAGKTAAAPKRPAPGAQADKIPPGGNKTATAADDDLVVPNIHARSFRGQPSPQIIVDQWLTPPPDAKGKFVLVDFWATWCGPCRNSIPHLNKLQARFKDRLVVIGLSDESAEAVRKMKSPKVAYSLGVDAQGRTKGEVQVRGIPHAMLIDPKGIVRFEGMPQYLTEEALERLIAKYSQ